MKLSDQFNDKNPAFLQDAQGNEEVLEAVRIIEERRIALKKKLEQHCKKHRSQWIERQATRLQARQSNQMQYNLLQPQATVAGNMLWNHHMTQAIQMVDLRIEGRKQTLNSRGRQMQFNAMRPMIADQKHQNQERQQLDLEVKDIQQSIRRKRMDVYRDFEANKKQRVEAARKALSQTPERDVYEGYKQQDRDILASKEHLLKQAYEKHGFNYEAEKQTLTQKYNHKM